MNHKERQFIHVGCGYFVRNPDRSRREKLMDAICEALSGSEFYTPRATAERLIKADLVKLQDEQTSGEQSFRLCHFDGIPPAGYKSWSEWLASPVKQFAIIKAIPEARDMIQPEVLQDIAALHGGLIPDVIDLPDSDKDRLCYSALCDDDTEVMEYLQESGDLSRIYTNSPDEAVRELQNAVWAAIEDSVSQQIEDYNESHELSDDEMSIKRAEMKGGLS